MLKYRMGVPSKSLSIQNPSGSPALHVLTTASREPKDFIKCFAKVICPPHGSLHGSDPTHRTARGMGKCFTSKMSIVLLQLRKNAPTRSLTVTAQFRRFTYLPVNRVTRVRKCPRADAWGLHALSSRRQASAIRHQQRDGGD